MVIFLPVAAYASNKYNILKIQFQKKQDNYKKDREVAAKKNTSLPTTRAPEFKGTVYPVRGREYFIGSEPVGLLLFYNIVIPHLKIFISSEKC
jgi:hypothetical protein